MQTKLIIIAIACFAIGAYWAFMVSRDERDRSGALDRWWFVVLGLAFLAGVSSDLPLRGHLVSGWQPSLAWTSMTDAERWMWRGLFAGDAAVGSGAAIGLVMAARRRMNKDS